ncbi:MAG: preprotein translocase subunit YajC, partial [Lacticaseibacillus paracasei]
MTFWQIILAIMVVLVCLLYLVAIPLAKRHAMQK